MASFILAFVISLASTLMIIHYDHFHYRYTHDDDLCGVQKFHTHSVPRVGGLSIFLGVCSIALIIWLRGLPYLAQFCMLLLAALPAFLGGMVEDLTKRVGVLMRLLLTMLAALAGFWLLGGSLSRVDMPVLDWYLAYWPVAMVVTAIAVAGIANAINIIDGYNGLAGVACATMLLGLGYVSFLVGDYLLWTVSIALVGAICGFLVWNYPRGLIFLGDGGAYFIGFMIGELSVLLVARHHEVSAWFPLLLAIYPIVETLFSIYRRVYIKGGSAGKADAAHLHQIIYKRLVRWAVGNATMEDRLQRNARTSPYLWVLCSMGVAPAVLFWNHTLILQMFAGVFLAFYVWIYRRLVRFRSPKFLIHRKKCDV